MRLRIGYLYGLLAAVSAVAFGAIIGPYWVDDAIIIAAIVVAVTAYSFWNLDTASSENPEGREYLPRSRIAHYALLSRIRMNSPATWGPSDPFERALLQNENWRTLSEEELREVAGSSGRES